MNNIYNYIIILFFVLPFCSAAQNQIPYHKNFTVEDGLPSNRVYDMIQDSKGYIWAGTDNGLVRFNGKEFKEYTTSESVNPEYSYLCELKDGSIWCVNFGNQVFKVTDDSLQIVDAFKPFFDDQKYFSLYEWKDNILYLESQNRIVSYDPFNNEFEQIINSDSINITNFNRDHENIYYSSTNKRHNRVQNYTYSLKDKTTTYHKKSFYSKTFMSNNTSFTLVESQKGHYPSYILPFSPLRRKRDITSNNRFEVIIEIEDAIDQRVNSITHLDDNNIWVSTKKGCINPYTKRNLFPKYETTRFIIDNENNSWISTYNSGIIFIPNIEVNRISFIQTGINQMIKINESEILLGGIYGYAYIYNVQKQKIRDSIFISEINTKQLILLNDENLLTHEPLCSLININNRFQNEHLKVRHGLNIKNYHILEDHILIQQRNNFIQLFHHNTYFKINGIPTLKLSGAWELSGNCDKNTEAINYCFSRLIDASKNIENIFYEAAEKRIWIAFTKKTSVEQNQIFKDFKNDNQADLKLNYFANHMDKGLIAAERKYGLVFIHGDSIYSKTEHDTYKRFGPIRKIITTDSLIISLAKKGIIISDKNGIPLHTLDETDGFKGSIIRDILYHSGYLFIGTPKGLFNIHTSQFHDNLVSPKTYINNILINNVENPISSINQNLPNNSDIEIKYEALCHKGSNAFFYEYKLREDENWKMLSNSSTSIRFPNLSTGKYKFQIRTINEENIKGESAILNFRVLPPFWLRWSFILSCLTIIGLILFFYNKRNLEKIERENQKEKDRIERENQLERERVKKENQLQQEIRSNKLSALQSRMNPHFIFNSLNSIQDFIIRLDKEGANEYLGIFSDLMRVYLSHSEKDGIELQEEIESLQLYLKLEELRFGNIKVDFKVDEALRHLDIIIPPLFIQPYIENAFKHGLLHKEKDKELLIAFKLVNDQLIIHIEDNGVGRVKVKEIQNKTLIKGLSYSTKANQTRLELLNHNRVNKIKVNIIDLYDQQIALGTRIEIIIPILN